MNVYDYVKSCLGMNFAELVFKSSMLGIIDNAEINDQRIKYKVNGSLSNWINHTNGDPINFDGNVNFLLNEVLEAKTINVDNINQVLEPNKSVIILDNGSLYTFRGYHERLQNVIMISGNNEEQLSVPTDFVYGKKAFMPGSKTSIKLLKGVQNDDGK